MVAFADDEAAFVVDAGDEFGEADAEGFGDASERGKRRSDAGIFNFGEDALGELASFGELFERESAFFAKVADSLGEKNQVHFRCRWSASGNLTEAEEGAEGEKAGRWNGVIGDW